MSLIRRHHASMRAPVPQLLQRRRPPHPAQPRRARRSTQARAAHRHRAQAGIDHFTEQHPIPRLGSFCHQRRLHGAQGRAIRLLAQHHQEPGRLGLQHCQLAVKHVRVCILAIFASWVSDRTAARGVLCLICAAYSIDYSIRGTILPCLQHGCLAQVRRPDAAKLGHGRISGH